MTITVKFQQRNGTAAAWTSANPVLAVGEVGFETDTKKTKTGDGTTAWNSLDYDTSMPAGTSDVGAALTNTGTETDPVWAFCGGIEPPLSISQTISNSSGSEITNYQIMFTIHRSSGTNDGNVLYIGENCDPHFTDLRFYDATNGTNLNYWIEDEFYVALENRDTINVWVKFPSIPTTGLTLQVIFGNTSAESESDGSLVFPFFDDFLGDALETHWTALGTGGTALIGNSVVLIENSTATYRSYICNTGDSMDTDIVTCAKFCNISQLYVSIDSALTAYAINASSDSVGRGLGISPNLADVEMPWYCNDTLRIINLAGSNPYMDSVKHGDWIYAEVRSLSGTQFTNRLRGNSWSTSSVSSAGAHIWFGMKGVDGKLSIAKFDWIFQRKYVATEPTHGTWDSMIKASSAAVAAVYS